MRLGMLIPLFLLGLVGIGWLFLAEATRRRKQFVVRLDEIMPGQGGRAGAEANASIRVQQSDSPRLERIARLLKVPLDLPLAHVVQPPVIFVVGTLLGLGAGWVCHFVLSWPSSVIAVMVTWVLAVRGLFGWELGRYQAKLVGQLPDTIQLVVSTTRAGLPVSEAFRAIAEEMASPTRDEFVRAEREISLGSTPDRALLSLHERTGVAEYAIFAVTIGVQAKSGGRLAETIQNLAETVRERLAIAARAKALAGEAKWSAIVMCILPLLSCLLMSVFNPAQMRVLITDPRGIKMLSAGIITLLIGMITMRQMINGASKD